VGEVANVLLGVAEFEDDRAGAARVKRKDLGLWGMS
jgi:hypothetical protein